MPQSLKHPRRIAQNRPIVVWTALQAFWHQRQALWTQLWRKHQQSGHQARHLQMSNVKESSWVKGDEKKSKRWLTGDWIPLNSLSEPYLPICLLEPRIGFGLICFKAREQAGCVKEAPTKWNKCIWSSRPNALKIVEIHQNIAAGKRTGLGHLTGPRKLPKRFIHSPIVVWLLYRRSFNYRSLSVLATLRWFHMNVGLKMVKVSLNLQEKSSI